VLKRFLHEEIVKAVTHQVVQAIQPPHLQQTAHSTSQKLHTWPLVAEAKPPAARTGQRLPLDSLRE